VISLSLSLFLSLVFWFGFGFRKRPSRFIDGGIERERERQR
jgi:hypothetical protein